MNPSTKKVAFLWLVIMALVQCGSSFSLATNAATDRVGNVALKMGLFDGIAKAFTNEDFKGQDQRVQASHILVKTTGDDDIDKVLGKITNLMGEISSRVQEQDESLLNVFSELAQRESQCPSAVKGGDLGMFGPKKMVKEFDAVLFPETTPPPPGSVLGPVVTDFGCHIILVTKREESKEQVEEKLARIDPDAI